MNARNFLISPFTRPLRGVLIVLWAGVALLGMRCKPEEFSGGQYPDSIRTVLVGKCAGCHNRELRYGGLDLSSYTGLFQGSVNGAQIIPYNARWSQLFWHVNQFSDLGPTITSALRMPYRAVNGGFEPDTNALLTRAQLEYLAAWINNGAPARDGSRRWDLQETRATGKGFALCQGSDLVAVIDLATNLTMRYIEVGVSPALEGPHFITLSPDKQFFYVTLLTSGAVEKYSTVTYQKVGRLEGLTAAAHVHLSPDGTRGVVSHWATTETSLKLTLFNAETMTVLDQLRDNGQLTAKPHGFAWKRDKSFLILTNNAGNFLTKVWLNGDRFDDDRVPEVIPINPNYTGTAAVYQPYDILFNEDESKAYVTIYGSNSGDSSAMGLLDVASSTWDVILRKPALGEGLGRRPRLMSIIGDKLYVVCLLEQNFAQQGNRLGCVSILNRADLSWERNLYRVGNQPHGIAYDSRSGLLYITSENQSGLDPPHHAVEGAVFNPGKINLFQLPTGTRLDEREIEIPPYGAQMVLVP